MTGDDHWSIGEVLSLLQDEFPEVTISKIRFLESQGLIAPERTPSGYRRFLQSDFDRLHWILTQQRDHYLPLKVIRDRLESGEVDLEIEAEYGSGDTPTDGTTSPGSDHTTANDAGQNGGPHAGANDADRNDADRDDADRDENGPAGAADREAQDGPSLDRSLFEAGTASGPGGADEGFRTGESLSEVPPPPESDDPKVAAIMDATRPVTERRGRPGTRADADANLALTLDELAEASGCDTGTLADLQRFGLITGRQVGPTVLFDGEALLLARFAAQFGAFGLDARHLRTLKIGAEREVSLLSQVIEPMLHRRDAETRARAVDTFDDLVDLAASFRAILVRQMVRAQLPSQRG